jgi:hypothetical protein
VDSYGCRNKMLDQSTMRFLASKTSAPVFRSNTYSLFRFLSIGRNCMPHLEILFEMRRLP